MLAPGLAGAPLLPADPASVLGGWAALARGITKDELSETLAPAIVDLYGSPAVRRGLDSTVIAATLSLLRLDFSRYVSNRFKQVHRMMLYMYI